jgi:tetratricopeptide (TPR) repeat protein
MEKARAAALRALELDEQLAEAHTALALIVENYDWDWQAAEREYLRAIQLDPNYATAHQWYAECLAFEGRLQEAFAESARARELDPLSLIIAADHGAILYYSRQYDRATAEFRSILDVEPTYQRATLIIRPFVEQGHYSEALAEIDKAGALQGEDWAMASRAFVYARMGQKARARAMLKKFQGQSSAKSGDGAPAVMIAAAYAGMGDGDQAFPWLERICSERSATAMSLKVDAAFDPVRQDPRFQNLLRKLRLAE